VNCPTNPNFENRAIVFQFIDTEDNWDKTVDSCSNIMINEWTRTLWSGRVIKTRNYVTLVSQYEFVAFHRPDDLPKLSGRIVKFFDKDEYKVPTG